MSAFAEVLSPEDVLLDLDLPTKKRVFEAVGHLLETNHGLAHAQVAQSLSARERLGSTGLGRGIALPHARIKGLHEAIAAFVRLKLAIPFEAPDGKPVSDMLILLVPEHATERHLELLAAAAEMFNDQHFREHLRMCNEAGGVCRLFTDWPQV
jgi:PTS system nitrogen regulatory IIA component